MPNVGTGDALGRDAQRPRHLLAAPRDDQLELQLLAAHVDRAAVARLGRLGLLTAPRLVSGSRRPARRRRGRKRPRVGGDARKRQHRCGSQPAPQGLASHDHGLSSLGLEPRRVRAVIGSLSRRVSHPASRAPGRRCGYRARAVTQHPPSDPPPPARRLASDTDNGLLLIISGPSGVGKTTITRAVERATPGSVFSVSVTTRPKTAADVEGVDYHFVSHAQFQSMIDSDQLLEHATVHGNLYGTPKAWVLEQLRRGRLVILEIDVAGAISVKRLLPHSTLALFILPPSDDALLQRLRDRKREDEGAIQRRFAAAQSEIAAARASGIYSRFIVNRDLHEAIDEARRAVGMAQRHGA
ncbi:MAG: guanylate kinase [Planctomyces sp.]|nr:guanylate kinase [Planctomyces sp.]